MGKDSFLCCIMEEVSRLDKQFDIVASKLFANLDKELQTAFREESLVIDTPRPIIFSKPESRPEPAQSLGSKLGTRHENQRHDVSSHVTFGNFVARTLKILFQLFATEELHKFRTDVRKLLGKLPSLVESPSCFLIENVLRHLLLLIDQSGSSLCLSVEPSGGGFPEFQRETVQREHSEHRVTAGTHSGGEQVGRKYRTVEEFQQDETLAEFFNELEGAYPRIALQSSEHIHSEEVILTCGYSNAILKFLSEAAKKRKFKVFIAEASPDCSGQRLACELAEHGIDTTLIADASIFAIMARVHKLLLRADVVLADGSVLTRPVCRLAAEAARMHSVPVLAITELFRISARFPHDIAFGERCSEPSRIATYASFSPFQSKVLIRNPRFALISSSHIAILVTDNGSYSNNFVYRLLRDLYGAQSVNDLGIKSDYGHPSREAR
jgi:translation initiation factor eIF-2B subunit beta